MSIMRADVVFATEIAKLKEDHRAEVAMLKDQMHCSMEEFGRIFGRSLATLQEEVAKLQSVAQREKESNDSPLVADVDALRTRLDQVEIFASKVGKDDSPTTADAIQAIAGKICKYVEQEPDIEIVARLSQEQEGIRQALSHMNASIDELRMEWGARLDEDRLEIVKAQAITEDAYRAKLDSFVARVQDEVKAVQSLQSSCEVDIASIKENVQDLLSKHITGLRDELSQFCEVSKIAADQSVARADGLVHELEVLRSALNHDNAALRDDIKVIGFQISGLDIDSVAMRRDINDLSELLKKESEQLHEQVSCAVTLRRDVTDLSEFLKKESDQLNEQVSSTIALRRDVDDLAELLQRESDQLSEQILCVEKSFAMEVQALRMALEELLQQRLPQSENKAPTNGGKPRTKTTAATLTNLPKATPRVANGVKLPEQVVGRIENPLVKMQQAAFEKVQRDLDSQLQAEKSRREFAESTLSKLQSEISGLRVEMRQLDARKPVLISEEKVEELIEQSSTHSVTGPVVATSPGIAVSASTSPCFVPNTLTQPVRVVAAQEYTPHTVVAPVYVCAGAPDKQPLAQLRFGRSASSSPVHGAYRVQSPPPVVRGRPGSFCIPPAVSSPGNLTTKVSMEAPSPPAWLSAPLQPSCTSLSPLSTQRQMQKTTRVTRSIAFVGDQQQPCGSSSGLAISNGELEILDRSVGSLPFTASCESGRSK